MDTHRSLEDVERKIFSLNFADGFIDIIAAAIFMQLSLFTLISRIGRDELGIYVLITGIFLLFLGGAFFIRKFVTEPRFGYVHFKPERKRRLGILFIGSISLLALEILLSIFVLQERWLLSTLSMSVTLLLIYIGAAFALDISRIYVYGMLAAIAIPIGKWMDILTGSKYAMPFTMIVVGLFMTASAIVVFVRFIRKYPLRRADE